MILPCEEVRNDTRDTFVLSGKSRSVIRGIGRDRLETSAKRSKSYENKNAKRNEVWSDDRV